MRFGEFPRVLSYPHPVYWAGFRSDTQTLQQAGWEFSAHEDLAMMEFGLAMRHSALGIDAWTNSVGYEVNRAMHSPQPFHVNCLTDRAPRFESISMPDWLPDCKPVDMQPQVVREFKTMDDLNLFAGCMARTNEVIVDPNSVPDLMERILEIQEPARQEYFKQQAAEMRRRARDPGLEAASKQSPRQNFHAQILSIAS